MSFGENLKKAMTIRNISASEIERQTDTSRILMCHYLRHEKYPKWYRAIDIADTLGVSLDWLFDTGFRNEKPAENLLYGDILKRDVSMSSMVGIINSQTFERLLISSDVFMKTMLKISKKASISLDQIAGRGTVDFL